MIYGLGLDIVEMSRIAALYRRYTQFPQRILHSAEIAYATQKHFSPHRWVEFLAGRFASKEAFAKALGVGIGADFSFHDLAVLPEGFTINPATPNAMNIHEKLKGKPICHYSPKLLLFMNEHRLVAHLSLAHTREMAQAQVILENAESFTPNRTKI